MVLRRPMAMTAAAVLGIVLAACGSQSSSTGDKGPIVLGVVIAETGALAPFDVPAFQGLKLAVKDMNAHGGIDGRKIKLIDFDIKEDFASGAVGAQKVIQQGAGAVVVACDFDRAASAAITATKAGKLTISLCAASPKFGPQVISPLAFTMSTGTPASGSVIAEWAFDKKHLERPYVLTDNTIAYDKDLCYYFEKRWEELAGSGSLAGQDTFQNDDANVSSQVARIRQAKPGFVVLCSYSPGGPAALRQMRAAGIDVPVLSADAMDGNYWLNAVPNLSNFYFATYASIMGDNPDPKVNEFFAKFKSEYGKAPLTSTPITGYALLQAYAAGVHQAGTTDSRAVAKAMDSFKDVPTVEGPTSFTPDLHMDVHRPMAIMQVQGGNLSFLETYQAQKTPPIKLN